MRQCGFDKAQLRPRKTQPSYYDFLESSTSH
jgi:hypothetical protein